MQKLKEEEKKSLGKTPRFLSSLIVETIINEAEAE